MQQHFPTCDDFCRLLINSANSLDPDWDRQILHVSLRKSDTILGKPSILLLFLKSFNKFNYTETLVLNPLCKCSRINLGLHSF